MGIEITIRHTKVPSTTKKHAEGKAEALSEEFKFVEHVHVIVDHQRFKFIAEVVAQGKNTRVEATADDEAVVAAVDQAFGKAEKQLRKHRTKVKDHRPA